MNMSIEDEEAINRDFEDECRYAKMGNVSGRSVMMYEMLNPEQRQVADVLAKFPFELHLTGSQKWANTHADSDYDFFCTYAPGAEIWLESAGFSKAPASYADEFCTAVYRREQQEDSPQIDVQLVKDAEKKKAAQELLLFFFPKCVPYLRRKELWEKAYKLV